MKKISVTFMIIIFLALGALIVFNRGMRMQRADSLIRLAADPAARVFTWAGGIRIFGITFSRMNQLAHENIELNSLNQQLISRLADVEALKDENNLLRRALGLNQRGDLSLIPAGIFHIVVSAGGYSAPLNRGLSDGISDNRAVISPDGALVGAVVETFERTARVRLINDPGFSVNSRVLGSQTMGITRGRGEADPIFDLIVEGDEIKQGDIVVSNGDDQFPPGIIIGTVSHAQSQGGSIFKKVTIRTEFQKMMPGSVLVISK